VSDAARSFLASSSPFAPLFVSLSQAFVPPVIVLTSGTEVHNYIQDQDFRSKLLILEIDPHGGRHDYPAEDSDEDDEDEATLTAPPHCAARERERERSWSCVCPSHASFRVSLSSAGPQEEKEEKKGEEEEEGQEERETGALRCCSIHLIHTHLGPKMRGNSDF